MSEALTAWFESPTIQEGSIGDIQFALATELIESPGKRDLIALLKSHGWRRVHRTTGHVYAHPTRRKLEDGAVYALICRALAATITESMDAGEHCLAMPDLRDRVARACKASLQGRIARGDFDSRFDRAFEAMHEAGKFKGWGFERMDGAMRYTYHHTTMP